MSCQPTKACTTGVDRQQGCWADGAVFTSSPIVYVTYCLCNNANIACAACNLFGASCLSMPCSIVKVVLLAQRLSLAVQLHSCTASMQLTKAWWYCRDASRATVLEAAGISRPRALAVVYTARARSVTTVYSLREHYPNVSPFNAVLLLVSAWVLLMLLHNIACASPRVIHLVNCHCGQDVPLLVALE